MNQARRLEPVIDLTIAEQQEPREQGAGFDVRALLNARGHEAFALHERYMNPQMPRILRTIGFDRDYVRAEGAYLFDGEGRRYLDFLAGFGVFALGRCHPTIERALRDGIHDALACNVSGVRGRCAGIRSSSTAR